MSSCCTLRLKRRSAFSRDSPSCNLTSAKETTPPNRSKIGLIIYCKVLRASQGLCTVAAGREALKYGQNQPFCSKCHLQRQLNLARRERIGGRHGVRWHLEMPGEVIDSNLVTDLNKVGRVAGQAVLRDRHQLVVTV